MNIIRNYYLHFYMNINHTQFYIFFIARYFKSLFIAHKKADRIWYRNFFISIWWKLIQYLNRNKKIYSKRTECLARFEDSFDILIIKKFANFSNKNVSQLPVNQFKFICFVYFECHTRNCMQIRVWLFVSNTHTV